MTSEEPNFETIKITDLKPADYNPRIINDDNFDKLKQSLNQFGLVDPIIINLKNENTIIGGHQRYQALLEKHEGEELYLIRLGDIGWVFDNIDLKVNDKNMEKALNINLNQNNLTGEWDNDKLKGIFVDLKLEEVDLEITGFNDIQINNISPSLSKEGFKIEDKKENKNPQSLKFNTFPKTRPLPKKKKEKKEPIFITPTNIQQPKPEETFKKPEPQPLPKPKPKKKKKHIVTVYLKTDEECQEIYDKLMKDGYLCTIN